MAPHCLSAACVAQFELEQVRRTGLASGRMRWVSSQRRIQVVGVGLAAGGTEAGLAGEENAAVKSTAGADMVGIAACMVAAENHALAGSAEVGALV
jgi:hypothetical protein